MQRLVDPPKISGSQQLLDTCDIVFLWGLSLYLIIRNVIMTRSIMNEILSWFFSFWSLITPQVEQLFFIFFLLLEFSLAIFLLLPSPTVATFVPVAKRLLLFKNEYIHPPVCFCFRSVKNKKFHWVGLNFNSFWIHYSPGSFAHSFKKVTKVK